MAQDKKEYGRTHEKQYTAWVTFPGSNVKIPGVAGMATSPQAPYVLYTPGGDFRPISAPELASKFRFVTDRGAEIVTQESVTARLVGGVMAWTAVKRVNLTGAPADVFAKHFPGKSNDGLGYFMLYPDMDGFPDFSRACKIRGDVFVRLYDLSTDKMFSGIATPKQAEGKVDKPTVELAVPKVAPVVSASLKQNKTPVTTPAALLESGLRQAADMLRRTPGVQVKLVSVRADKDGAGKTFYRGDLQYKFPITTSKPIVYGELDIPVVVTERAPDKAEFKVLTRGESHVAPATIKQTAKLDKLTQPLVIFIQDRALQIRNDYSTKVSCAKLLPIVEAIVNALSEKVAQMKYEALSDKKGYKISCKPDNALFGTTSCTVFQLDEGGYRYVFVADDNLTSLVANTVSISEDRSDTRSLASAVVSGFGKLKKAAEKLRDAESGTSTKKNNYDYRLVGRGKNEQGEQLYILERLASGARSTMNRTQLIKLLEAKRVENAYVRWYKNDRQIRLRGGGSLTNMDVAGIRRSSVNRAEGAKAESEQLYSEVIKSLAKKDYTPDGALTLTDQEPLFGSFAVNTPDGHNVKAMYSVTEWKYGATNGGQVSLKGTVPEDSRRRSALASSLVSLIQTAAKGAVASTNKPTTPIVPAVDDDFSNADADFDTLEDASGGNTDFADVGASPVMDGVQSVDDVFAGLEDAPAPVAQPVPQGIANSPILSEKASTLYDDAVNMAMSIGDTADVGEDADSDAVSTALDEIVGMRDVFIDAKNKLEAMLSGAPGDPFLVPKVEDLVQRSADIEGSISNLENVLKMLGEAQAVEERINGLCETAIQASAMINTRTANTPAMAATAELVAAGNEMMEYKNVFDTAFTQVTGILNADPTNAFVKAKFDDLSQRNRMNEANLDKLGEMLKTAQVAEAKIAAQTATQTAPVAPADDPFGELGDDLDALFYSLPGEILNPGR